METKIFWKNKNVLITGGTQGLGAALAQQLGELGANVAVVARTVPTEVANQIHFIKGDVGRKHEAHRIFSEAITHLGSIDVLINNASTLGDVPLRLLLDTDCETLESVLETNLLGAFRLTKLVVPAMVLRAHGLVINLSSDAAVQAYPRWGAYGVSKAALDHLTRIFATELTETGVRFLALDPGDMNTALHRAAVPNADLDSLHSPRDSATRILEIAAAVANEIENENGIRRGVR